MRGRQVAASSSIAALFWQLVLSAHKCVCQKKKGLLAVFWGKGDNHQNKPKQVSWWLPWGSGGVVKDDRGQAPLLISEHS